MNFQNQKTIYGLYESLMKLYLAADELVVECFGPLGVLDAARRLLSVLLEQAVLVPVESTNVRAIGYLPAANLLFVRFDGGVYAYTGVPPIVAQEFNCAASKGKFFAQAVKGKFTTHKLEETRETQPVDAVVAGA